MTKHRERPAFDGMGTELLSAVYQAQSYAMARDLRHVSLDSLNWDSAGRLQESYNEEQFHASLAEVYAYRLGLLVNECSARPRCAWVGEHLFPTDVHPALSGGGAGSHARAARFRHCRGDQGTLGSIDILLFSLSVATTISTD